MRRTSEYVIDDKKASCIIIVTPHRNMFDGLISYWIHSWTPRYKLGVCPKIWKTLRGVVGGSRKIVNAHNRIAPNWDNFVIIGVDESLRVGKEMITFEGEEGGSI